VKRSLVLYTRKRSRRESIALRSSRRCKIASGSTRTFMAKTSWTMTMTMRASLLLPPTRQPAHRRLHQPHRQRQNLLRLLPYLLHNIIVKSTLVHIRPLITHRLCYQHHYFMEDSPLLQMSTAHSHINVDGPCAENHLELPQVAVPGWPVFSKSRTSTTIDRLVAAISKQRRCLKTTKPGEEADESSASISEITEGTRRFRKVSSI